MFSYNFYLNIFLIFLIILLFIFYQRKVSDLKKAREEVEVILAIRTKARTRALNELARSLEEKVKRRTKELEESRIALMGTLEDVEDARKIAEEEKDKTLSIITNFSDGLLFFDKENKLSLINPQAEKFFDIKNQNTIGKSVSELESFGKLNLLVKIIGNEIKKISKKELLLDNLTLEISTISIIKGEEKKGTLVILHDITREKMIEKLKTEFVSLSAHQLRTPLSAIKWTLRMLLDGDLGKITEEQKEYISKTYQSNERMIDLINDLLNVTRIEEGKYLSKPVLADFQEIVQSAISSSEDIIQKRKIKFKFEKPEEKIPKVKIDKEKIELVIQNLLTNALIYTGSGGEVIISLQNIKEGIEFKISDTGIGIPKIQQERVFTKFFRGSNAMRVDTGGTGLGLYISKNIVEAHNGKIWFESKEGNGTTFYFTLPCGKRLLKNSEVL